MKIIIINKKRAGVTIIIAGLVLILLALAQKFDWNLKYTAIMSTEMPSFTKYEGLSGKLTYLLPEDFNTKLQSFGGGEIIYHNDFYSGNNKISGFIQVWNINEDLKKFLQKSSIISEKQNIVKNYSLKPITDISKNGYEVRYDMMSSTGEYYKVFDYYIKTQNGFVRISFSISDKNYNEGIMPVLLKIVRSINFSAK